MKRKMKVKGLGANQKAAIQFVRDCGGAANTWKIQVATGIASARYLHQLIERGIIKKVDTRALLSPSPIPLGTEPVYGEEITGGQLTSRERQALNRAKRQNPRAYVFWVLSSAAKSAIGDVL